MGFLAFQFEAPWHGVHRMDGVKRLQLEGREQPRVHISPKAKNKAASDNLFGFHFPQVSQGKEDQGKEALARRGVLLFVYSRM